MPLNPSLTLAAEARLNLDLRKLTLLKRYKHGAGATDTEIQESERGLDVEFPPAMREFLRRIGWVVAGDLVIFGLGSDVPIKLHLTRKTIAWQRHSKHKLPEKVIPLSGDVRSNAAALDMRPESPTYGTVIYHDFVEDINSWHVGEWEFIPNGWSDYLKWLDWEIEGALQAQEEAELYKKLERESWQEFTP